MKKPNPNQNTIDVVKACKRADREMQLENNTGFVSVRKVHKSKKDYNRASKFRKDWE
jgi:hypothetical protein